MRLKKKKSEGSLNLSTEFVMKLCKCLQRPSSTQLFSLLANASVLPLLGGKKSTVVCFLVHPLVCSKFYLHMNTLLFFMISGGV